LLGVVFLNKYLPPRHQAELGGQEANRGHRQVGVEIRVVIRDPATDALWQKVPILFLGFTSKRFFGNKHVQENFEQPLVDSAHVAFLEHLGSSWEFYPWKMAGKLQEKLLTAWFLKEPSHVKGVHFHFGEAQE